MLERVAVICMGVFVQRFFEAVDHEFRGLVAVDMQVHLDAFGIVGLDQVLQLLRRVVPDAVGRAVMVARPFQPRGEALDRPVGHDLDDTEVQLVIALGFQHLDPFDPARNIPHERSEGRHDPHLEIGIGSRAFVGGQRGVIHFLVQVGTGGHTRVHPRLREPIEVFGRDLPQAHPGSCGVHGHEHGGHFLKLSGDVASSVLEHAFDPGFLEHPGVFQHLGIHVHDVE